MSPQQYVLTIFPQDLSPLVVHPPAVPSPSAVAVHPSSATTAVRSPRHPHRVSEGDVMELIAAAGPVSVEEIAGAFDVPDRQATAVVGLMLDRDCLRPDEWGRLRLWGGCRDVD